MRAGPGLPRLACLARAGGRGGGQEAGPVAAKPALWPKPRASLPGLHSELSPPATRGCLLARADPSWPLLGTWGGGRGPQGPASQALRPPQPSPPSQQGRAMGRPTGPPSTPAPAGTAAETGLTPALTAGIPCESGVPGGARGQPGPGRGSAAHGRISGPSLCPPQGPAGRASRSPPRLRSSSLPASSASSAVAAADAHAGGSPGTRRPWAWPVPAVPPPRTW